MITNLPVSGGGQSGGFLQSLLSPLESLAPVLPTSMLSEILGSIDTLNPLGGLSGGPGMIQGLFDESVPNTGLTGILDMLNLKGRLPKGWLATGRDAAPIVGSAFGNVFMPGFGGPLGSAAGSIGSSIAFGNAGDSWKHPITPTINYIH
jgi:hypothetical protein